MNGVLKTGIERLSELLEWVAHATDVETSGRVEVSREWADALIGSRVGGYVVTGVLGAGGMGVVLLARDEALGREVALKVLRPDLRGKVGLIEEARVAARLNHPRVAVVHGVGREGELDFIAMERIRGENLRCEIERGRFSGRDGVERAVGVLRQVAEVLAHAHGQGLAHRDLKPENVMIEPDGGVRLLDFGLSAPMGERARLGAGTRGYRDGATPSHRSDARADVFAFGVMTFELIRGRLPSAGERVSFAGTGRWRRRLEALCRRCLDADLARRPADGSALVAALAPRGASPWWWVASGVAALVAIGVVVGTGGGAGAPGGWRSGEPTQGGSRPTLSAESRLEKVTSRIDEIPIELAAISPDGREVAWVDGQGLVRLDLETRATRRFPLARALSFRYGRIGWSSDGRVEVAHERADTMDAFRLDGGTLAPIPAAEIRPYVMAHDGRGIGWERVEHRYFVVDPDGTRRWVEGTGQLLDYAFALSPDRTRAAIIVADKRAPQDTKLLLIDIAAAHAMLLLQTPRLAMDNIQTAVTWVSDSTLVVGLVDEGDEPGGNLWELEARPGATPRRLTHWVGQHFGHLSASADGRTLALVTTVQQTDVWLARMDEIDGALQLWEPRRVTWDDADERPSMFAADGSLLYGLVRKGRPEARRLAFDEDGAVVSDDRVGALSWPVQDGDGRLYGWEWREGDAARLVARDAGAESSWRSVAPEAEAPIASKVGRPGPSSAWFRCPRRGDCVLARDEGERGIGIWRVGPSRSGDDAFDVTLVGYRPPATYAATTRWDLDADGGTLLAVHGGGVGRVALSADDIGRTLEAGVPCWPQYPGAGRTGFDLVTVSCVERPSFRMVARRSEGEPSDGVVVVRSSDHRWMAHPVVSPDGRWVAWAERVFQTDIGLVRLEAR